MAFIVNVLLLSALLYGANAGYLTGHHSSHGHGPQDSFLSSALNSPSASFGPPSQAYGAPAPSAPVHFNQNPSGFGSIQDSLVHHTHGSGIGSLGSNIAGHIGNQIGSGVGHIGAIGSGIGNAIGHLSGYGIGSLGGSFGSGTGHISGPGTGSIGGGFSSGIGSGRPGPIISGPSSGPSHEYGVPSTDLSAPSGPTDGNLLLDSTLPGNSGSNRGPGTIVNGRPDGGVTRYELQSVVQNVIRRIPVEVTRHVQVPVPQPIPVPVRQEVKVPVPQPYPVHVNVVKHVPYNVYKTEHVPVDRPVPYEVVKKVPVEVIRKVPVPVDRPYEVIKKVHVPVEKRVEVPVPIWKPYPLHIIKHITHYKKKSCCW